MGFPIWTLWGMAITAMLALLFVGLALFFQSPTTLARFSLANRDMYQRAKTFTGLGFACILLAFGFFLAGVPLETGVASDEGETAVANTIPTNEPTATQTPQPPFNTQDDTTTTTSNESPTPRPTSLTPQSGAFGGPPPSSSEEEETTEPDTTSTPENTATLEPNITPSPTSEPTSTLTPSPTSTASPTPTPSAPPTNTPTPTLTPTPIVGETATVELGGNTLWVRRSPGGQEFSLLQDGDTVILGTGYANQSGLLWREITTVNGLTGWVQVEFLTLDN